MCDLKYDTDDHVYGTETDSDVQNSLVAAKVEWGQVREVMGVWQQHMWTSTYKMHKQGPTV